LILKIELKIFASLFNVFVFSFVGFESFSWDFKSVFLPQAGQNF